MKHCRRLACTQARACTAAASARRWPRWRCRCAAPWTRRPAPAAWPRRCGPARARPSRGCGPGCRAPKHLGEHDLPQSGLATRLAQSSVQCLPPRPSAGAGSTAARQERSHAASTAVWPEPNAARCHRLGGVTTYSVTSHRLRLHVCEHARCPAWGAGRARCLSAGASAKERCRLTAHVLLVLKHLLPVRTAADDAHRCACRRRRRYQERPRRPTARARPRARPRRRGPARASCRR